MMIPCLCLFPFTALRTLAAESPLNRKYPNLFRKKSGSGTNDMVEN